MKGRRGNSKTAAGDRSIPIKRAQRRRVGRKAKLMAMLIFFGAAANGSKTPASISARPTKRASDGQTAYVPVGVGKYISTFKKRRFCERRGLKDFEW
jgi:hypothetical protein